MEKEVVLVGKVLGHRYDLVQKSALIWFKNSSSIYYYHDESLASFSTLSHIKSRSTSLTDVVCIYSNRMLNFLSFFSHLSFF